MTVRIMGDPTSRFWARVDKTDTCWNWTATPNPSGYGRIKVGKRAIFAHRFSWVLHGLGELGSAPLDHKCLNPKCVRPSHLRIVTTKQNSENLTGARSDSRVGVRGVKRTPSGRPYEATVNHYGQRHYLGRFDSLEDAERAVVTKRLELYSHNETDKADAERLGITINKGVAA